MRERIYALIDVARDIRRDIRARYIEWRSLNAVYKQRDEIYEDLGNAIANAASGPSDWSLLGQLQDWQDRAERRRQPIAHAYAIWASRMAERGLFSEAITGTVPIMDVITISTSEHIGKLGSGLLDLANDVRRLNQIRKTVQKMVRSLALPCIAICAGLIFYATAYIPMIASMADGTAKLSGINRAFYAFGQWIPTWWPLLVIIGIAIWRVVVWSLENWTGIWRDRLDNFRLSPYPYYRDYTAAQFMVTLNRRLSQGEILKTALEQISNRSSRYLELHCNRAISRIEQSYPMSEILDTGIFNQALMDRISDYVKQGNFTKAISNLANQSFTKVEEGIVKNMEFLHTALQLAMYALITVFFGLIINTIISTSSHFHF